MGEGNTDGEGSTAIILLDTTMNSMTIKIVKGQRLSDDERAELLNAIIMATGATTPDPRREPET